MSETKVVTGKVRLSYLHAFAPASIEGGDPKYSVSVIIPKSDKATIKKIEKAVDAAIKAGEGKLAGKNGKVNKAALKLPLRDGDIDREDDPAYKDCYFLNASSKNKPGLVDKDLNPIMDQSDLYSGCYGRVSINLYAFNTNGNKGIACGLNNIQKLSDGEPLGAYSDPEDDFGDDFEDDGDDDLLG